MFVTSGLNSLRTSSVASKNAGAIGAEESVLLTESNASSVNGRDDSYRQIVIPKVASAPGLSIGSRIKARIYNATSNALYAEPVKV